MAGRCRGSPRALLLPLLLAGARSASAVPEAAVQQVPLPPPGSPLPDVPVLRSKGGALRVTLRVQPVRLVSDNISLTTRAFNGGIPGPTIAVRPGDRLSVLMVNELGDPAGPTAENNFHHPNHTNLHVHGLHVSPLAPSDDVLTVTVHPGSQYEYHYDIPRDHAPGTYWAHPHYHGSSVMQIGAGAVSGLVVLDPPGFLSPQLEAMPERLLVLQDLAKPQLLKAATASSDGLFSIDDWRWGNDLWLVNGAPQPVLTVRPGQWNRLRLVDAGVSMRLNLTFGACEVALLAKDGIYISDFPRAIKHVLLPPGGRADLAVRCPPGPGGRAAEHAVMSSEPAGPSPVHAFAGKVFTIVADGEPARGLVAQDLLPWSPPWRPAYLQDLRSVAAPTCSCSTAMGGTNSKWIDGHLWEGPTRYMHRSPLDAVIERRLKGVDAHPYHQHTFPFQLMSTPKGGDAYFKVGDWHDTYNNVDDPAMTIRFFTADFEGPQLVHCHNLLHSDGGMVAVEWVGGKGAEQCGCDLLNYDPDAGQLRNQQDQLLVTVAAVTFVAMLVTVTFAAVHLTREWHRATSAGYEHLPDAPTQPARVGWFRRLPKPAVDGP